jgi:hypothetical protein
MSIGPRFTGRTARTARHAGFALAMAAITPGCAGADASAEASEEQLRAAERGFEYDCTTPASRTLIEGATSKVLITDKHLRFEGTFGPSLGERDPAYKAPAGKQRVRYAGFATGEDCEMKVVADQEILDGKPTGGVRIQCWGDDFQQDLLLCSGPRAATLTFAPPPPPPPPPPATPPAGTRKWACATKAESPTLGPLTMQVTADAIRVVTEEFDYTSGRNHAYRARSGSWMSFNDLSYGGDCSLSVVVAEDALVATTTTTALKVRCAGETFQEDRYTCTPE